MLSCVTPGSQPAWDSAKQPLFCDPPCRPCRRRTACGAGAAGDSVGDCCAVRKARCNHFLTLSKPTLSALPTTNCMRPALLVNTGVVIFMLSFLSLPPNR